MASAKTRSSRALDWWCSIAMLGFGMLLALPGDSLLLAGPNRLTEIMPEAGYTFLCLLLGTLRMAALIINGRLYEGAPAVRTVGAVLGTALWAELAWGYLDLSFRLSIAAPALWLFAVMVGCDVHNAMRAASETIHARRARERR